MKVGVRVNEGLGRGGGETRQRPSQGPSSPHSGLAARSRARARLKRTQQTTESCSSVCTSSRPTRARPLGCCCTVQSSSGRPCPSTALLVDSPPPPPPPPPARRSVAPKIASNLQCDSPSPHQQTSATAENGRAAKNNQGVMSGNGRPAPSRRDDANASGPAPSLPCPPPVPLGADRADAAPAPSAFTRPAESGGFWAPPPVPLESICIPLSSCRRSRMISSSY